MDIKTISDMEQEEADFVRQCRDKLEYEIQRELLKHLPRKVVDSLNRDKPTQETLDWEKWRRNNNFMIIDALEKDYKDFIDGGGKEEDASMKLPLIHKKIYINGEEVKDIAIYHPEQKEA